ncbi:DUF2848 family protein [Desulfofustis glycolicus]|uniref:DUF2848 domain-containing protein n=1 Tax=Desulfofustis glycolicus DSM 9705 TaxID=1121409 RepID=A0A1M5Y882_9BACT|nr:DUF2848 family protein [Desulfofustis glycolicus]MCB2216893.1 DUF2848 domain-containing protein [Desulfobulbaceae bacterium]SHI08018.1 Protein of unknown function [Desulfofustis glycolicus DSM 9705]
MQTISFTFPDSSQELVIDRLVVAGWVGKDRAALQKHIDELAALGVTPPGRTPTYMNLSPSLLTSRPEISVVGPNSSGEVEAVVVVARDGQRYLTVGSDHTDRQFEQYGIPESKQMCAKPMADAAWPLDEVQDHLAEVTLRSWITEGGRRRLYQEGTLAANRDIFELLAEMPSECVDDGCSFCMFCGTFAAIGGLSYGERFEIEMADPLLKRRIAHTYDIRVLPQFI